MADKEGQALSPSWQEACGLLFPPGVQSLRVGDWSSLLPEVFSLSLVRRAGSENTASSGPGLPAEPHCHLLGQVQMNSRDWALSKCWGVGGGAKSPH